LGPILAGLICGPYVGIGAGLIGAAYRVTLGGSNVLGAAIGPILAGALSGLVYLLNKKEIVSTKIAILATIVIESLVSAVTLLIRVINAPGSSLVPVIINVAIPMIILTSIAVGIFSLIIHNLINERKTREEKEKLEHEIARKNAELEIAADIQRSFLPETIPQIKGYDIAATSLPAKEVGGDFFDVLPMDVIPLPDQQMGVLIADVSGKGVPAALFMALSRVIVRTSSTWFKVPSDIIRHANSIISSDSKTGMFVTLFYGIIDKDTRKFTFVNAGHNPPILYHGDSGTIEELEGTGIALGIMDDAEYEQKEVRMFPGDTMILYTDGVTEAINEREEMFEVERLVNIIKETKNATAQETLERIISSVFQFSGTQPQFDDITLMIIKVY
jgi:sigma-B regulation protein RsbU (phosphoserine phosphatase)